MSQALQSKIHLLAVLLSAFTLLSIPMFMQLREDSADASRQAKTTLMSRFFRDLAKQFNDEKLSPQNQPEDYWGQQAQQNNPQCQGSDLCNPDGDLDGDGVSNADEVRDGRNPACDENKHGDYCETADRYNVTTPPPAPPPRRDLLFNRTFGYSQGESQHDDFLANANYTRLEMWINATGYAGIRWEVRLSHDVEASNCVRREDTPQLTATDHRNRTCEIADPPLGVWNVNVTTQLATGGTWEVRVYGVVSGS